MKTTHDYIRERLLRAVRLPPDANRDPDIDPREIAERQVDWVFLEQMIARLVMGWFRYGDNRDLRLPRHDHIKRVRQCCDRYMATGDVEALVDGANMFLLEAMKAPIGRGSLPTWMLHFHPVDDGQHTDEIVK